MHSISTEKAPAAIGPYSQGVVVNGLLFASGQIALSPKRANWWVLPSKSRLNRS